MASPHLRRHAWGDERPILGGAPQTLSLGLLSWLWLFVWDGVSHVDQGGLELAETYLPLTLTPPTKGKRYHIQFTLPFWNSFSHWSGAQQLSQTGWPVSPKYHFMAASPVLMIARMYHHTQLFLGVMGSNQIPHLSNKYLPAEPSPYPVGSIFLNPVFLN